MPTGWDGAGNFILPYSMVAEAAAGVKILASHQDTMWQCFQTGIQNCLTRDGQNAIAADVSWGGHKITSLGTPTASTDAVNKAYADSVSQGEWIPETQAVTWVSTTSFKVSAANKTAIYHAGRRLKIAHNGGATTTYGTVVSSSFATDTTVVVAMDAAVNLVSTVTAVSYGLLGYTSPSYLDPRSVVLAALSGDVAYTAAAAVKASLDNLVYDNLTEFDAQTNKRFTAQHPGFYSAIFTASFQQTVVAARNCAAMIYLNGAVQAKGILDDGVSPGGTRTWTVVVPALVQLIKGDYLEAFFSSANNGTLLVGTGAVNTGTRLQIARIS